MELEIGRYVFQVKSTIGRLKANGKLVCHTLEDKDRGLTQLDPLDRINRVKVPHETAIPYGRYKVILNFSQRFQCIMPLVMDVPGYSGVRIHWGNKSEDTDGCPLTGDYREGDQDWISSSKANYAVLMDILERAVSRSEDIWLTVKKAI